MKIGVRIMPRKEVLDTQGRAVQRTLEQHGHQLENCRVGKFVELNVNETSRETALAKAKEIAEFVLYNPLIETYQLEVMDK